MHLDTLPAHPTAVYPAWHQLAGQAVRALHVDRRGCARYPVLGGAPDPEPDPTDPPKPDPDPKDPPKPDPDDQLGFPKNTPVRDMTPDQKAAYWEHQSKKHEGRYKTLVGDRSFDDVKKDLEEYAEVRRSQQTPAEQQLTERYEQGRRDATSDATTKAATAILTANLRAAELGDDEIAEILAPVDVSKFVGEDGDIDTDKLATFAGRFTQGVTPDKDRRPDFGGGRRPPGDTPRGSRGKEEAARRFGKKTTDD